VSASGSKTYYPAATTTYTLKAYSEAGGESRSLTVIVEGGGGDGGGGGGGDDDEEPEIICTPGALKCIGPDLYVCNTKGTAWALKTANSPTCAAGGSTPDFWKDPIGWVIAVITQAWESMLGFVTGQFNLFLANLKNFQNNFATQLAAFIADPLKSLRSWLDDVYAGIQDIANEVTKSITEWWDSTATSVQSWIDDATGGITTWFNDQVKILQRGWDNVTSGLQTWFSDQIGILQRGWNNVVAGIRTWTSEQIGILQRGWDQTFAKIPGMISTAVDALSIYMNNQLKLMQDGWNNIVKGINTWVSDQLGIFQRGLDAVRLDISGLIDTATAGIHDFVYDTVPGIVENVIMGLIEGIPGLQTVIDFIGSLYDTLTGKYPKDPELNDIQKRERDARERLRLLFERK
jgi:phage-related protein